MKYTLESFTEKFKHNMTQQETMDLVAKIIIEASLNSELLQEALNYINGRLDWASAIERSISNMSENN
jgi:hypothetical protein